MTALSVFLDDIVLACVVMTIFMDVLSVPFQGIILVVYYVAVVSLVYLLFILLIVTGDF
jgi:hypothetical protein